MKSIGINCFLTLNWKMQKYHIFLIVKQKKIIDGILRIYKKIINEDVLFIHCSAGYHRPGMIIW